MMQIEKNKIITMLIIIILVITGGYFIWNTKKGDPISAPVSESSSTHELSDNMNEYIGMISSTTNSRTMYTNQKYSFRFSYPSGWRVGDNHLGYGTFQIMNYDITEENGGSIFPKGKNKIEAVITSENIVGTSPEYHEEKRTTKTIIIDGQHSTKIEVELTGGQKIVMYNILLPIIPDKYLSIRMYGDPSNFYVLDDLMKSLKWLKNKKIEDSDPNTFTLVGNGYFAKDMKHVYLFGEILPFVSASTFVFVGGDIYKDAKTIFRYDQEGKRLLPVMRERDAATFRIPAMPWYDGISPSYTIDKNGVYFKNVQIDGADPETFTLLDTKVRDDGYGGSMGDSKHYALDGKHVYYEDKFVSFADPKTFHILSGQYYYDEFGSDSSHVFFLDHMIKEADPATFVSLTWQAKEGCRPNFYSKDATHVFFGFEIVIGADVKTFEVFEQGRYGRDKYHIYEGATIRPDLDVKTFTYTCGYG